MHALVSALSVVSAVIDEGVPAGRLALSLWMERSGRCEREEP